MKAYNKCINIGQLTLENRVVLPPMASQTADENGFVTEKTLEHYARLCQSQTSLVMAEYSFIHLGGRSEKNQLGVSSEAHIEGLSKLNAVIKDSGAASALQIVHAGGKSSRDLTDGSLLSPSGIQVPVKGRELEIPDPANEADIQNLIGQFVMAATRAVKAGFDMVEIHCAHGYGLNQWISPITNKRTDAYGVNNQGRFKILTDIIEGILEIHPKLAISTRIPGQDHFPGGLEESDSIELAQLLEKSGVSLLNISSGIGGWRRPRDRKGEGYLVSDAEKIQKRVDIPVMGVGGIKSSEYLSEKIGSDSVSLLAVGRSILENENWGAEQGIRRGCENS